MCLVRVAVGSTLSSSMRRQVVFASAAGALSLALAALAQQTAKPRRVGVLSARRRPPSLDADYYGAFPRRLNELGYVEGTNLHIEWRFADGEYQRLPELAAQLVKLNVDVILALGPPATLAAQQATATIPIVFVVSADPVASGIVKSLARPGGNTTGLSNLGVDLSPKHLELLLTIAPDVSRVALLINPANPAHRAMLKELETAIQASRVELLPISAQRLADIQGAFSSMELQKVARSSWRSTPSSSRRYASSRRRPRDAACPPSSPSEKPQSERAVGTAYGADFQRERSKRRDRCPTILSDGGAAPRSIRASTMCTRFGDRSLDDFLGAHSQRRGDTQPERSRGAAVDDELEHHRLLDRQVARSGALQDPVDVLGSALIDGDLVLSVAHEAADRCGGANRAAPRASPSNARPRPTSARRACRTPPAGSGKGSCRRSSWRQRRRRQGRERSWSRSFCGSNRHVGLRPSCWTSGTCHGQR